MIAEIFAAFQMGVDDLLDGFRREQMRAGNRIGTQRVEQQRAQRTAQPSVGRDIEALFLPLKNGSGQLPAHQLTEYVLLARAMDFQMVRQRSGELHDAMVQESRPQL